MFRVVSVLFAARHHQLPKAFRLSTAACPVLLESDSFKKLLQSAEKLYSNSDLTSAGSAAEFSGKNVSSLRMNAGKLLQTLHEINCRLSEQKQVVDELQRMLESSGNDHELKRMAEQDLESSMQAAIDYEETALELLVPPDVDDSKDAIIECSCGAGGQESMLFAAEMFDLYRNFAVFKGWNFEQLDVDFDPNLGGLRQGSACISGRSVYGHLKFEGGVHRVQRVPVTESGGRIHTSTMSVAVMPKPEEVDVVINDKDVKVETFRSSGKGGQHVNKTESAVRITHIPSGTIVSCQTSRSQIDNRKFAFDRLRTILYQKVHEERLAGEQRQRKLQIGSKNRSEKIRTYNFQQDRITDHRIKFNLGNTAAVMRGGAEFQELLNALQKYHKEERFHDIVAQLIHEFQNPKFLLK